LSLFNCAFVQFFGMTEMSGSVTFLSPADHDPARPHLLRTVGKPYPGAALEIRGPDRRVLKRNEPGEIWIKSPTMMAGYHGQPEKTADAVVDGWYPSGDGGFRRRGLSATGSHQGHDRQRRRNVIRPKSRPCAARGGA
jgi:fatty-acyl-CoA synthase